MHPNVETFCVDIPAGSTKDMAEFQAAMDMLQDEKIAEENRESKRLGISKDAASTIMYLRTRSRWTQEKENHLIQLDKQGETLPNVLAGEF